MELDGSFPLLALALTPGLACRLCARLLRKIGAPDRIFRASLTELEGCSLPARVAQAVPNKDAFQRAEQELAGIPQYLWLPPAALARTGISSNAAADL
jgi:predicted Rossmann fold nucleotide-binding protein DprA/Smf involved in DNA uptake